MNSINFLWDAELNYKTADDEAWYQRLVELIEYYENPENYKTVPLQSTILGGWLNEQMTEKLKNGLELTTTFQLATELMDQYPVKGIIKRKAHTGNKGPGNR